jgi:hypothetical protein
MCLAGSRSLHHCLVSGLGYLLEPELAVKAMGVVGVERYGSQHPYRSCGPATSKSQDRLPKSVSVALGGAEHSTSVLNSGAALCAGTPRWQLTWTSDEDVA